jgi:hypothetical protein
MYCTAAKKEFAGQIFNKLASLWKLIHPDERSISGYRLQSAPGHYLPYYLYLVQLPPATGTGFPPPNKYFLRVYRIYAAGCVCLTGLLQKITVAINEEVHLIDEYIRVPW